MNIQNGVLIIAGMCLVILVIGLMKKKTELILNFAIRMVMGMVVVHFFNNFLEIQGIPVSVGMNPWNSLTMGTLGIGGVALLYGISFCSYL